MATGYAESSYESIPGNESNSPTQSAKTIYFPLRQFSLKEGVDHMERDDENRNQDEPLPVITEHYAPSWELESRMYPDLTAYLLKAMLGAPTTTAGDGIITDPGSATIPVGAYRHVWTAPFGPAGASPQTSRFRVAYSDQGVYYTLKGAACEKLTIETPEKGGAMIKASGPGLYLNRSGSTFGLTPSYESLSIRPWVRKDISLTWASGSATTEDFQLEASNPVDAVRTIGGASKWPDTMEKGEGVITWTGSIPKRQLDIDDLDKLIAATGFTATATWTSESIIASSYPYKLFVQFSNCQYVGGDPDPLSNKRRIGGKFNFRSSYNGSASVTVTLVNATTSYA